MACNIGCKGGYYCDSVTNRCETCQSICDPRRLTPYTCRTQTACRGKYRAVCGAIIQLVMSPLRRHIFVCFLAKWGFFGPSSVEMGRTHIVLGWNMSGPSTSTYPENLGSGGQVPAEIGGRVSLFFVCMFVRHAKTLGTESLDGAYMHCTWGERA